MTIMAKPDFDRFTPEKETVAVKSLPFFNIKPGGNDTALLVGIPSSQHVRTSINDVMQRIYPNIEQVGFINDDPTNAQLMMAGGEFCGNAARSAAYQILRGRPGTSLNIQVSGVKNPLRAGITSTGEAFAQMPVYSDPARITEDPQRPGNVTVEMEGISHYLDFNTDISELTKDKIKSRARAELAKRGLDKGPAAGIMHVTREGNTYRIAPVVYVRDVDTTYYETACGSGTTALGLALALQQGKSIRDVPILQPSGLPLSVSVDFDNKQFGYTQIQGPIETLNEGTFEASNGIFFAVEKIKTEKQLKVALEATGLREVYRDAFGRPPYNELFEDTEIDSMFEDYRRDGDVFVAVDQGQIIAFVATQPVQSVPEIGATLSCAPGVDEQSWYIPDLGIRQEYEGNGIAKTLTRRAIDAVPTNACITLRTNVDNLRAQGLYTRLGFEIIPGVYQEISQTRTNGDIKVDRRLFMALHRDGSLAHTLTIQQHIRRNGRSHTTDGDIFEQV